MNIDYNTVLADVVKSVEYDLRNRQVAVMTNDNSICYFSISEYARFTHGKNPNKGNLSTANRKSVHDKTVYFNCLGQELRKQGNDTLTVLANCPVNGSPAEIEQGREPIDMTALSEVLSDKIDEHRSKAE